MCAQVELESVKAANSEREQQGLAQAYGEDSISEIISNNQIGCNDIATRLYGRLY